MKQLPRGEPHRMSRQTMFPTGYPLLVKDISPFPSFPDRGHRLYRVAAFRLTRIYDSARVKTPGFFLFVSRFQRYLKLANSSPMNISLGSSRLNRPFRLPLFQLFTSDSDTGETNLETQRQIKPVVSCIVKEPMLAQLLKIFLHRITKSKRSQQSERASFQFPIVPCNILWNWPAFALLQNCLLGHLVCNVFRFSNLRTNANIQGRTSRSVNIFDIAYFSKFYNIPMGFRLIFIISTIRFLYGIIIQNIYARMCNANFVLW